jgi:hypothetical protein
MATLFDSASLALIPSGVKDGKVYSIKPTDGSGDFTFSRGTDTATRVNSSGLIEKERMNLLLQSNTFDTTWVATGTSVTGGQSGYDGSSDAWLLNVTATGAYSRITQSTGGSSIVTNSIYAKAGTTDFIAVSDVGGGGAANVWFDLGAGTIGTIFGSQIIDANIESVGGGWYRCSVAHQGVSPSYALWFVADADNTTTGTIGANVYIQDAQQEEGLVATAPAIETTTAAVYEGITDNLPRLDYSGGASCPSLLLEGSRTNLIVQSEYIEDSVWSKTNATITTNYAISPEGVQNASLITFSSGGFILESVTTTKAIGDKETISVFSNADISGTFLKYGGGTAAGTDVEGREVIGNGWFRYYVTRTFTEAETALTQLVIAQSDVGNSVLIYGAQLEAGHLTSYIPTYGTSASRAADFASSPTNTLGGLSEGTFFIEMERDAIDTALTGSGLSLRDNSGVEEIRLHFDAPASQVRWRDGNNSFAQIGGVLSTTAGTTFKILVKTDGTTAKAFGNGAQLGGDYSVVSAFDFQRIYNNGLGHRIKQQLFFPTALTDAECIALTTI